MVAIVAGGVALSWQPGAAGVSTGALLVAPYSGDTDKDFVAHKIPHHRGAIDMAKVELKYGKDPDMKRLAKSLIKAQNEKIAYTKKWQAKHAGK
jgi:uncharacterized protein (DUF305 family)